MLKNHPFAVEAFFERSLVLTFAVPKEQLARLIPECLELDTYADQWAFLAVAMVQTKKLRPKGFPAFMGNDFFLIGYRVFVRYTTEAGKRLRGLYILKSETNRRKMQFFGNIFTHYNYSTTDVNIQNDGLTERIVSKKSRIALTLEHTDGEIPLPPGSPFPDWATARRYAGPLPFTFTFNRRENSVLIIEGVRQNWQPAPVWVLEHSIGFLEELALENAILANAFEVRNIPYYWKKGKIDRWNP